MGELLQEMYLYSDSPRATVGGLGELGKQTE